MKDFSEQLGILIALLALFSAIIGFIIAHQWSKAIGIPIMKISFIIGLIGLTLNYIIIFLRNRNNT